MSFSSLLRYILVFRFLIVFKLNAETRLNNQFHIGSEKSVTSEQSKAIIESFYHYFNTANLDKLFSLISEDIENEINYAEAMKGKEKAIKFIKYNMEHYDEHASDYTYMISDDGNHVAVKLKVTGKYIKTDQSNIPAIGQNYELTVFNYFEIKNNQIFKAKCYFDESELSRQLKKNSNNTHMIDNILDYWFDPQNHSTSLYDRGLWWEKNANTDNFIKNKFEKLRTLAIQGELNDWLNSPKGTLAYVILIDQFSRNMYRDTPQMFQYDELARTAAKQAIENGQDIKLSLTERVFLYLPFEHSEDLSDQNFSVSLFKKLHEKTPINEKEIANNFLTYAKKHQEIIQKFKRFPHRNKILSRTTTKEEEIYLKTNPGF